MANSIAKFTFNHRRAGPATVGPAAFRSTTPVPSEGLEPSEPRLRTQALFNAKELVEFGDSFASAARTRLDVARARRYGQIGDECVLRFTGAVRNEAAVVAPAGQFDRIQRLCNRPNLIELDQNRVGDSLLNSFLENSRVSAKDVIADKFHLRS